MNENLAKSKKLLVLILQLILVLQNLASNTKISRQFKSNQMEKCVQLINQEPLRDESQYGDTVSKTDLVIRHYEQLPYPQFSEEEIKREEDWYKFETAPLWSYPSTRLEKINHFLRRGNENFKNYYRFMVAGGGTGGVTVFNGEQLRHTNAEIVYFDFSSASMKISQIRARIRKLENIIWIHSWIEEVRFLGLGLFKDFQCSGVLHHLKSPLYGLNILKDQLTSDGGINIMVYGLYGRSGVYQMQKLMKMINTNTNEIEKEIKNTNLTLSFIPENNWLNDRNMIKNDQTTGDIDIYDLFLHKRDVAYSIKTLFSWLEDCGIHFIDFDSIERKHTLKLRHQKYQIPNHTFLIMKTSIMRLKNQLHSIEIFKGSIIKQDFFASKIEDNEANLFDSSSVLYTHGNPIGLRQSLTNKANIVSSENQTIFYVRVAREYRLRKLERAIEHSQYTGQDVIPLSFLSNDYNHFLIHQLSYSNRGVSLKDVWSDYRQTTNFSVSDDELTRQTMEFYDSVKDTEMFLIRKRHVAPFPTASLSSYYKVMSR